VSPLDPVYELFWGVSYLRSNGLFYDPIPGVAFGKLVTPCVFFETPPLSLIFLLTQGSRVYLEKVKKSKFKMFQKWVIKTHGLKPMAHSLWPADHKTVSTKMAQKLQTQ